MKKQKDILPKSQLVSELKDCEFIKQPYLYATIGGDFTLTERSIMIELMNSLQDQFNQYLKKGNAGRQLVLFPELGMPEENDLAECLDKSKDNKQTENKIVTLRVDTASIGVKPDAYHILQETCDNLKNMSVTYIRRDAETGQLRRVFANVFAEINMPVREKIGGTYKYKKSTTRRESYVEVQMTLNTLRYLCDLGNGLGYMNHLRHITRICRRKRTPSIYIYLTRWKDIGSKSVNLVELKKYLGLIEEVTETDKNGNKVKVDKDLYPKFSRFCSTVLDPIKEDLDELSEHNLVDFTFDYKPLYKNGAKRGNPENLQFQIKLSGLGEELRQQRKRINQPADAWTLLRTEYKLTDTDVKGLSDMLPEELVNDFRKYVLELGDMVKRYKPRSVKAYVITSLKNFITSRTPEAHPEPPEQKGQHKEKEASPTPQPTEKELQAWQIFMDVIQNNCTVTEYNTWLRFLDYGGTDGSTLTIKVPTAFFYTYIQENFKPILARASQAAFGEGTKLRYDVIQK